MIRIQGRVVVYGEVWLDEEPPEDAALAGVDVAVYRNRPAPVPNAWPSPTGRPPDRPVYSLRSDLMATPEAIMGSFDETCRRHVRRAERQDGLQYEVIPEAADALDEFAEYYDQFARQKGLWPADRHWLARATQARQLILSCASHAGERRVWHAHLRAGSTVQMVHSVSLFRGADDEHRALVARANRWLHWRDMLNFKAMGLRQYDWGGVFVPETSAEEAGINRFKRSFGGRPVVAYHCTMPVSLRGRLWLMFRGAFPRRRPDRPAPAEAQTA